MRFAVSSSFSLDTCSLVPATWLIRYLTLTSYFPTRTPCSADPISTMLCFGHLNEKYLIKRSREHIWCLSDQEPETTSEHNKMFIRENWEDLWSFNLRKTFSELYCWYQIMMEFQCLNIGRPTVSILVKCVENGEISYKICKILQSLHLLLLNYCACISQIFLLLFSSWLTEQQRTWIFLHHEWRNWSCTQTIQQNLSLETHHLKRNFFFFFLWPHFFMTYWQKKIENSIVS